MLKAQIFKSPAASCAIKLTRVGLSRTVKINPVLIPRDRKGRQLDIIYLRYYEQRDF